MGMPLEQAKVTSAGGVEEARITATGETEQNRMTRESIEGMQKPFLDVLQQEGGQPGGVRSMTFGPTGGGTVSFMPQPRANQLAPQTGTLNNLTRARREYFEAIRPTSNVFGNIKRFFTGGEAPPNMDSPFAREREAQLDQATASAIAQFDHPTLPEEMKSQLKAYMADLIKEPQYSNMNSIEEILQARNETDMLPEEVDFLRSMWTLIR